MSAATVDALRTELMTGRPPMPEAYRQKQIHEVPTAEVKDRKVFVLERVAGKTVLELGASGPLHDAIAAAAARCYGLDKQPAPGVEAIDLDDVAAEVPAYAGVELVVAGEVLEHLSNPGWLLDRLRRTYGCPLLVTVPNAFSQIGLGWLNKGIENVNREHVAYYSYRTVRTLLERHGFTIAEFYWYHGHPKFSEGLIVVTE